MRILALIAATFTLAACGMQTNKAVDASKLPPLTGKEQALMTTAQVAASQGNIPQAEKGYLQAVGLSQGHVDAHLALAELYTKTNQTSKAEDVLRSAAEFQPNQPRVNYLLGKIYLQQNNPRDALAAFERGLGVQPTNMDLLVGKGIAHDMLREHTKAQVAYQHGINSNPTGDVALARTNLAMSLLLDNKPERAAEILKADAAKDGASAVTRHNLALAYGMLGRHTEAKALLGTDLTEDERQASLKRLAQYIAQRDTNGKAVSAPVTPVLIKEAK